MIHKLLAIGSAATLLAVVGTASADGGKYGPPAQLPAPPADDGKYAPPAQLPAPAPLPCPPPVVPAPAPPSRAVFGFESGAGVLGYLDGEIPAGPAWQVRIRAIVMPELALETTYLGSISKRHDNEEWMVSTQIDGGVRYTPFAAYRLPAQVFTSAGVGYAHFSGRAGDDAALVLPLGVGAETEISRGVKAGGNVTIRPVFLDDLSTAKDAKYGRSGPGGDSWTAMGHISGEF